MKERNDYIQIRASKKEKEFVKEWARREGTTQANAMRRAIRRAMLVTGMDLPLGIFADRNDQKESETNE